MSRYLVITAGSPRGGEATWDSLYENVLNPLNADLAIATSKDYVDESLSLFKKQNILGFLKIMKIILNITQKIILKSP